MPKVKLSVALWFAGSAVLWGQAARSITIESNVPVSPPAWAVMERHTLQVMSVIALTIVPIVLAYQAWTYWVFRKRLTDESHLEY